MTCKQLYHESNIGDANLFNKLYRCFNPLSPTSHDQISPEYQYTSSYPWKGCENRGSDHEREIALNLSKFSKLVIGYRKRLETGRRICILASGLKKVGHPAVNVIEM